MDEGSILAAIGQAVEEETGSPTAVTRDMTASDIPGWDSLAHVRIVYNIEAKLGMKIDVMRTYDADNLGELVDMLLSQDARRRPFRSPRD